MNEWPADPVLDAGLKELAANELAAAMSDSVRTVGLAHVRRTRAERSKRQHLAGAALAFLAILAVVGSLAIREMRGGAPGVGGGDATATATDATRPSTIATATPAASGQATPATSVQPTINPDKLPAPVSTQSASPWFTAAGSMRTETPMSVALADGRVLFVSGFILTLTTSTPAELYDPATGKFSPTGVVGTPRAFETLTRLRDGRVLLVGGLASDMAHQLASAELYDPATGRFTPTGSLHTARQFHTATLLSDGRVLIAGGYSTNGLAASGDVVLAAYHPTASSTHPLLAMTDSQGVLASAEIYDPATGQFTPTGSMSVARDNHTASLLADGRVLMVGGGSGMTSAEIYDPKTGTFSRTGSLRSGRWLQTATVLLDGRVLVAGGRASNDSTYASAELYDPRSGKFMATGSMTANRQEDTATLLPNGKVLITGGLSGPSAKPQAAKSAELYDPASGKFSAAGTMISPRMDQTASLLADGRVLIAGGDFIGVTGEELVQTAEIYTP